MIPIQDTVHARRFPLVNTILLGLNILVFMHLSLLSSEEFRQVVMQWGLVPARFYQGEGINRWVPVFTSMFLHGGWAHVISNMLALYIFGDNVEDRMGSLRYLIFYLATGFLAGLVHLWAYRSSTVPTIGASGAIAGVLGAYLVLYPLARVITLIPLFFWFQIVEVPALFYLGIWFISQLFNGFLSLSVGSTFQSGGVAWWAHIGGFVSGLIMTLLLVPRRHRRLIG